MEAEYVHNYHDWMRTREGSLTWLAELIPIHYCSHSLGPLLSLEGDRCRSAVAMHTGSQVAPELGTIDQEVALFRTDRGAIIKILVGFSVAREPGFHYYTVYGTKGSLERPRPDRPPLNSDRCLAYFREEDAQREWTELPLTQSEPNAPEVWSVGGHGTAEWSMIDAFIQCIREDTPSPIDVYQGLDMCLPGLCAHQSAETDGAIVEVPDPRLL
jgi:predicted dehydrogenase